MTSTDKTISVPLTLNQPRTDFYKSYVSVVGALFKIDLSEMEIRTLDCILFICKGRLSIQGRKDVATSMNISIANLNNLIKKLKDRTLINDEGELVPILKNEDFLQEADHFKLVINFKHKES